MSVTVTLHAWWLAAWLAVGAVLFVPTNWWGARHVTPHRPLLDVLLHRGYVKWTGDDGTRPYTRLERARIMAPRVVVQIVVWPLALWECLR